MAISNHKRDRDRAAFRENPNDAGTDRRVADLEAHEKLDTANATITLNSDGNPSQRVIITEPSLAEVPGPTDLTLTKSEIQETASIGTTIGNIIPTGGLGPYTFTITDDPDSKFAITGNNLEVNAALDSDASNQHSVTIEVEDTNSNTFVKSFIIDILPPDAQSDYIVKLNGIDESLSTANIPELSSNVAWSICFTIIPRNINRKQIIFSQQSQFSTKRGLEIYINDNGRLTAEYIDSETSNLKLSRRVNGILTPNVAQFVVITYDGTEDASGFSFRIDDAGGGTTIVNNTGTNFSSSDNFLIGEGNNNRNFLQADLNNLLIFNGVLSNSQITTLYNSGSPLEDLSGNPGLQLFNILHAPITDIDVYPTITDLRGNYDLTMNANMTQSNLVENI